MELPVSEHKVCPVCGDNLRPMKSWLGQCPACGFFLSSLRPGAGTGIEGLETLRRANFERLLDFLAQHKSLGDAKLLEVGCAKGWFLEAAARRGASIFALEPEDANAAIARANGFNVKTGFFPGDLSSAQGFDVIAFNDVFEHLPDPVGAARALERALLPGGIALINLPSSRGAIFKIAGLMDRCGVKGPFERLWQKGLPSPHVSYFNPETLDRLIAGSTQLQPIGRMSLASMSRHGLFERIKSTSPGALGNLAFAGAWLLSFVVHWLPPDVTVGVYRKTADARTKPA